MSIWNDKRHNLNVAGGAWRQSGGNWALCYRVECLQKERERERKGESYEVSWLVANHLLSFIHPQTNSPRTNRHFFLSLARQIWLDGIWQPTIFQRSTEWEYGNLVNNMYTLSFEGMNTEHVDTELMYETVITKHIKISATAVHLELHSYSTHCLWSWAKNIALLQWFL